MIGWLVLFGLLLGLPILAFAFAPRSFRRFCLIVCLPWFAYVTFLPHGGPDNPLILLDAIPYAVLIGAIAVEIAVFVRRALAKRAAHG